MMRKRNLHPWTLALALLPRGAPGLLAEDVESAASGFMASDADELLSGTSQALSLPRLYVDPSHVSIAGHSSGADLAVQFHVAFSELVQGSCGFAAAPWHCSAQYFHGEPLINDPGLSLPVGAVAWGVDPNSLVGLPPNTMLPADHCKGWQGGGPQYVNVGSLVRYARMAADAGLIDDTANLKNTKAYLFYGTGDNIYWPGSVEKTATFWRGITNDTVNLKYEIEPGVGHMVTHTGAQSCLLHLYGDDIEVEKKEDLEVASAKNHIIKEREELKEAIERKKRKQEAMLAEARELEFKEKQESEQRRLDDEGRKSHKKGHKHKSRRHRRHHEAGEADEVRVPKSVGGAPAPALLTADEISEQEELAAQRRYKQVKQRLARKQLVDAVQPRLFMSTEAMDADADRDMGMEGIEGNVIDTGYDHTNRHKDNLAFNTGGGGGLEGLARDSYYHGMYVFNQREFFPGEDSRGGPAAPSIGMLEHGYLHVPKGCESWSDPDRRKRPCKLMIYAQGCGGNGPHVMHGMGLVKFADEHGVILLFPTKGLYENNRGTFKTWPCWDVYGLNGRDYAFKTGKQMAALHKMVMRLLGTDGSKDEDHGHNRLLYQRNSWRERMRQWRQQSRDAHEKLLQKYRKVEDAAEETWRTVLSDGEGRPKL